MDTIFVEENATRGEELTAPPSPHNRTAAQPERPLCTTVDMFVADVIYDGRFLDSFTTAPERVAEQLGIQPTPEVLEVLRGRDSRQVLSETTARMTRDYYEARKEPGRDPQAFFVVIGVAVAGVVVVCIVDIVTGCIQDVEDPESDQKL